MRGVTGRATWLVSLCGIECLGYRQKRNTMPRGAKRGILDWGGVMRLVTERLNVANARHKAMPCELKIIFAFNS